MNSSTEVAVGGGDHADVHRAAPVLADAADLAFLQHPQQFDLHARRDLADLVEQERAPVRRLEQSGAVLRRPGEGARDVAKELGLERVSGTAPQLTAMNGPPVRADSS